LIIDAHVHLYRGESGLDDLLEACDACGIDKVCLSACGAAFDEPDRAFARREGGGDGNENGADFGARRGVVIAEWHGGHSLRHAPVASRQ